MPTDLSRRDVLRLGLVVTATASLAACTTASNGGPTATDPGGPDDPDRGLRAEIGRDESRLSTLYAAAAGVLTGAAATRVAAVGARHEAYRQAIDPDRLASSSPAASGATGGAAAPAAPTLPPVTAATALRVLTAAEAEAAAARATQSTSAVDPSLARVIVLAGAGAASAAAVLAAGRSR